MNALVPINTYSPAPPSFTMGEIERIAIAIAKGGAFGSNDPNAVLTLCLLAQAEGKHPAIAFRDYHVIQGKPAKKADAMLVDFLAAGGRVEWHALSDDLADATFSHPAGGNVRISWDKARVNQAQLGGNPMHKKYPRQMLRARTISEGVRTVYPGATSGLYVPEEVQDFAPASIAPPTPQPMRARQIERMPELPAPDAEPTADNATENLDGRAASFINAIRNAADRITLGNVIRKGKALNEWLAADRRELFDQVEAAVAAKHAELDGATDAPGYGEMGDE